LEKNKSAIVLIAAVTAIMMCAALLASGVLVSSRTIASSGIVATANIGFYSDSACTQSLTSINWGTISPGNSVTRTVYVKNLGTTQVTLSMSGENWTPASANEPITVTWNREGTTIAPNQVATATLTLEVSSSVSGIASFSVDIVIAGAG
jgi:hypothetical protein